MCFWRGLRLEVNYWARRCMIVRMQVLSYHASVPVEQLDHFKVRTSRCYLRIYRSSFLLVFQIISFLTSTLELDQCGSRWKKIEGQGSNPFSPSSSENSSCRIFSISQSTFNVFCWCWWYKCSTALNTRKLCYRKDDRAMPPCDLYMDALKFWDSLTTPIATIPNIFYGLLFRSKLWMFVQNFKKNWSP